MDAIARVGFATACSQHAFFDHVACAVETFFTWLEHEDDIPAYLLFILHEKFCCADQHRDVEIMATGMHCAIDLTFERKVR